MYKIKRLLCLCFLATFLFTGVPKAFCVFEDGIIAIVNDNIITLKDFKDYLGVVHVGLSSSGRSQEEIQEIMTYYQANGLDKLINDKLMVDEANKLELVIRDEMIDERVDEIKARYPSEKAFRDDVVAQGLNITDMRKKVVDQIKAQYIEDIRVRQRVFVSPQSVNAFYEENIHQFKKPETVVLDSIFIPFEDDKEGTR